METDNSQNLDKFDKMLSNALHEHKEPVRPGFTNEVLKKIDAFEEQQLLKAIAMRQRLALTCSIVWVIALCATIVFFGKDILRILTDSSQTLMANVSNVSLTFKPDWELILVVAVSIISVIYAFSESLDLKKRLVTRLFG